MRILDIMLGEFTHEAAQTRKVLERVPFDKVDYKPHEKSMTLGKLAGHVSDLTGWTGFVLGSTELDVTGYKSPEPGSTEELLAIFDKNVESTKQAIAAAKDEDLGVEWKLVAGSHVIMAMPRGQIMRGMCFNHTVHHRGQLIVYLRLVGVPVPGLYGPSADEM